MKDGDEAWLIKTSDLDGCPPVRAEQRAKADEPKLTPAELELSRQRFRADVRPESLAKFCEQMGFSQESAKVYGIGFDARRQRWTFPMYNHRLQLCGFRLRNPPHYSYRYSCLPGSSNGLFVPLGHEPAKLRGLLLPSDYSGYREPILVLPEGPTDCIAAMDAKLLGLGRPSNKGGRLMVCELIANVAPQVERVIFHDRDPIRHDRQGVAHLDGYEGFLALAGDLVRLPGVTRVIGTPDGCGKDIRDWIKAKGGWYVNAAVRDAKVITPKYVRDAASGYQRWQEKHRKR